MQIELAHQLSDKTDFKIMSQIVCLKLCRCICHRVRNSYYYMYKIFHTPFQIGSNPCLQQCSVTRDQ